MTGPGHDEAMEKARPSKTIKDRYGNEIEICKKCRVPVRLQDTAIKCMNGCLLGCIDCAPNEFPSPSNSYNPWVRNTCQACGGDWNEFFQEEGEWCVKSCDTCQGKGSFVVKKHSEAEAASLSQPLPLDVDDKGWTRCPGCNFRFMVTDPNVWQGDRHKRCSQRLTYKS